MSTTVVEPVQESTSVEDDDCTHWVCHCTDHQTAACGKDVSAATWVDDDLEDDCLFCFVAWPDDAPTCPWGCACEDACGPWEDE